MRRRKAHDVTSPAPGARPATGQPPRAALSQSHPSGLLRSAAWFFLRLLALYALLVAPWPGWAATYARGYRAAGDWLFGNFGGDGVVRFEPPERRKEQVDTQITIGNRRTRGKPQTADHSARLTGYLPTALLAALVLATPVPWWRRLVALAVGLVLVHALIAVRVYVALLYGFSQPNDVALYAPSPFWAATLKHTFQVVTVWVSFAFVAPLFLWALITLRRRDVERWLRAGPT